MTALPCEEVQGKVSAVASRTRRLPGLEPQDSGGEDRSDLIEPLGGGHQVGIEGVGHRRDLHGRDGAEDKHDRQVMQFCQLVSAFARIRAHSREQARGDRPARNVLSGTPPNSAIRRPRPFDKIEKPLRCRGSYGELSGDLRNVIANAARESSP